MSRRTSRWTSRRRRWDQRQAWHRHDAAGGTEAASGLTLDARNGHSCGNRRRREGGENARCETHRGSGRGETSWNPTDASWTSLRQTREIASQARALEAVGQAEREKEDQTSQKSETRGREKSKEQVPLTENLSNAAISIQRQKTELPPSTFSSSSSSLDTEGSQTERKNDKGVIEEDCTSVTEAVQQVVGSDRTKQRNQEKPKPSTALSHTDEMVHRIRKRWSEQ